MNWWDYIIILGLALALHEGFYCIIKLLEQIVEILRADIKLFVGK